MSLAREIQGVPMRAGIPALTRAVRSEQSTKGELTTMAWQTAIGRLFGERIYPPFRDESQLSKRGPRDFLGHSEVDEKRAEYTLVEFSQTATQTMLNEKAGLPFLFLATELVITWQQNWETLWTEIYNVSWAEVGPEGLGRETKWKAWSEQGGTHRYKHQFTIPNEALVDPDFGLDTLRHGLEGVVATALFTIMTETSIQMAMRPMFQEWRKREREGNLNYTYADYRERQTRYFLAAAMDVNVASRAIVKHMHGDTLSSTPKNLLLFPDGCEDYLSMIPRELRAFPSKMIDETDEAYILGQRMKELTLETDVVERGTFNERTAFCVIPTWKRTRDEPEWRGLQPLRRRLTLAHAYRFPTMAPPESPEDELHANNFAVLMHRLVPFKEGAFEKVWLADGIEESLCGGLFADKVNGGASSEMLKLIEDIQRNGIYGDIAKLKASALSASDGDDLSTQAEESVSLGNKTFHFHRSLSWNMHFLDEDDGGELAHASTIGETMEGVLSTRRLFSYARKIASMPDRVPFLVRLFGSLGVNTTEANRLVNLAGSVPTGGVSFEHDLAAFFATALGKASSQEGHASTGGRPASAPATLAERLRALLPERSLETLAQLSPVLDQLATEQPAAADKLVLTLEEKIRGYTDDAGTIDYVMKQAVSKLNTKGFTSGTSAALPILSDAVIRSVKGLAVPLAEAATVTFRADLDSSPEWESRRSFARHVAPVEDAMDLDAGAHFGAEFPRGTAAIGRVVLVDRTRLPKLADLVPTAAANEVAILARILATPLTPRNIAHFLRCGIQLINAHATRFRESVIAGNMVSMRGAGETVRVLMTPLMTSVTQRGVTGGTDFTFTMKHGLHWIDPFGVGEMPAFFPGRVLHGFNTRWIKGNAGHTAVAELAQQLSGYANPLTANDVMLVTFPITETRFDYPLHALVDVSPVADVPGGLRDTVGHRNSGYYTLRHMLMEHGLTGLIAEMETVVSGPYTNGDEIHFDSFVDLSPTWHFASDTKRWSAPVSGSGPRGADICRDAWSLGKIMNGDAKHFPSVPATESGF